MKITIIIFIAMLCWLGMCAQETPVTPVQEQALENLAEETDTEIDDDALIQQLDVFKRHPLNLNTARVEELQDLQLLNPLQVDALIQYRTLLGKLVNIYELQAIPYWDIATIQRVLPYITITEPLNNPFKGVGTLTVRYSSSQKLLMRYRYNYKNILQYGVLTEKDAGEKLFDFNSFHVFVRKLGIIQSLAIGDFTVNMGQGLIQWQSLSLGKSSEITAAKRQSAIIRPYTSAGEVNFHRGVAVCLRRRNVSATAFASFRKLDANMDQQAAGGSIGYDHAAWHVGGNFIHYHFSKPLQKRDEPYNLFAFSGRQLLNYSIDYDYTFRNVHGFGEVAASAPGDIGMVHGLLISLDRMVEASLVARHIQPGFQSMYSGAFTESAAPSNESGVFFGLALKPGRTFLINMYADVFSFPWLRSRADGPSTGHEYLLQLDYTPHKKLSLGTRARFRIKEENYRIDSDQLNVLRATTRANWRMHINWQASPVVLLKQRMELIWFNKNKTDAEQGYLIYNDVNWNPAGSICRLSARLQFFETNGFNSRLYAFENDFTSGFAVHAVYHKGVRFFVNFEIDLDDVKITQKTALHIPLKVHFRWDDTIIESEAGAASQGNSRKVFKVQLIFSKV